MNDSIIQLQSDLDEFLSRCDMYDLLESAVGVVASDNRILYQNPGFRYLCDQTEALGSALLEQDPVDEAIRNCRVLKKTITLTERISFSFISAYPLTFRLTPIVEGDVVAVLISIAEGSLDTLQSRLRSEEKGIELQQQRIRDLSRLTRSQDNLIQSLLRDMPIPIMVLDNNQRIVRMNRACEELLNTNSAVEFGITCDTFLTCAPGENSCSNCSDCNATGIREARLTTRTGEQRDILLSTANHTVGDESFILQVFFDITERKQLESLRLTKEREVLEATAQSKSRFYASLSHELRTPLNAIIGYSEMLLEDAALDSQSTQDIERIHTAGAHLLRLVNGLLDISKIDAGKIDLDFKPVQWPELCNEVIEIVRPAARKNGNEIACDYTVGDHQQILTDRLRLKQILLNLLDNACKFTSNGKVFLFVKLKNSSIGDIIQFTVKDTGIGMEPEQLSKVFLEYEQADRTISKDYGGTGLGLPISNRLALLLDGTLTANSEPGTGTTITLELPANSPSGE